MARRYDLRTQRIRRKYGEDAFREWGALGGNPVLVAQGEGRVTIHKKKPKPKKQGG